MRRVLERSALGRQHNVTEKGQLGVPQCGPVHSTDHGHLDVQQIHQQVLPFPINRVPGAGTAPWSCGRCRARTGELLSRSGHNHYFVLGVAADVGEGESELSVRKQTPLQRAAVCVERELEDAIPAFHADGLILGGVLFKSSHGPPSFTAVRGTCWLINALVAAPVIYPNLGELSIESATSVVGAPLCGKEHPYTDAP